MTISDSRRKIPVRRFSHLRKEHLTCKVPMEGEVYEEDKNRSGDGDVRRGVE